LQQVWLTGFWKNVLESGLQKWSLGPFFAKDPFRAHNTATYCPLNLAGNASGIQAIVNMHVILHWCLSPSMEVLPWNYSNQVELWQTGDPGKLKTDWNPLESSVDSAIWV
jgi:hypothetical protein